MNNQNCFIYKSWRSWTLVWWAWFFCRIVFFETI